MVQKVRRHASLQHIKEIRVGIELDHAVSVKQVLHCCGVNAGINVWRCLAGDCSQDDLFRRLAGGNRLDFNLNFGVLRVPFGRNSVGELELLCIGRAPVSECDVAGGTNDLRGVRKRTTDNQSKQ